VGDFLKWLGDGFKEEAAKQAKITEQKKQNKKAEKQYQQERLEQLKRDHIPYCPKCKSTQITYVNKKLSLGRAITGGVVGSLINPAAGGAGAVLGGLTSKKGKVKCLNCGHEWKL
jgi:ribosomal protein S27E